MVIISYNNIHIIIIFISSFEINQINIFPARTPPFPLIFLSNLFIAFEAKLITNPRKLSLAKGIVTFVSDFFSKLIKEEQRDPPG